MRRALTMLLVVVMVTTGVHGSEALCDPALLGRLDDPLAYQPREGRCEGIYAKPVGADRLLLRSLTYGSVTFDASRDHELEVSWPAIAIEGRRVSIRANSLRFGIHYRMDSGVSSVDRFAWPISMIDALRLEPKDLGYLAWVEGPIPNFDAERLFLPISNGPDSDSRVIDDRSIRTVIIPSRTIDSLEISVRESDSGAEVWRKRLAYLNAPALQPLPVEFPMPTVLGWYRLSLSAGFVGDGMVLLDVPFFGGI